MKEYHKIQSIYKRDQKTNQFIIGDWALPEIGYLATLEWIWDEKIDGTNIRVYWDGTNRKFGGRTDNAQIPVFLFERLETLFTVENLKNTFGDSPATLYGEGFGAKIQSGGDYLPTVDFILFDVLVGEFWLERQDTLDIADKLGLRIVEIMGRGTIKEAMEFTAKGFQSCIGSKKAEGLVLRPSVQLYNRKAQRIITKVKTKDFK